MLSLEEFEQEFVSQVRTYNSIIQRDDAESAESLKALSVTLCKLLELGEVCPDAYNDNDSEPPEEDVKLLREKLEASYPSFGWYRLAYPQDAGKDKETTYAGDAIDDLLDIYLDINHAAWQFSQEIPENGAWYAKLMFNHWGLHAINLKRYLHYRLYDW